MNIWSDATVKLGEKEISTIKAIAVRESVDGASRHCGFKLGEPDLVWNKFVNALTAGQTHSDLDNASRFMP
jgi:hypothetical protein